MKIDYVTGRPNFLQIKDELNAIFDIEREKRLVGNLYKLGELLYFYYTFHKILRENLFNMSRDGFFKFYRIRLWSILYGKFILLLEFMI